MARPKTFMVCAECGTHKQRRRSTTRFCSKKCARSRVVIPKGGNSGSFRKAATPWNKGMEGFRAGESRPGTSERISAGLLARPGQRISPENERTRKLEAYKKWRKSVFERDGYACVECGDKSAVGHRVRLNADHILPFASHPELRLEVSNGRTMCEPCHRKTPTYGRAFTGQKAVKVGDAVCV